MPNRRPQPPPTDPPRPRAKSTVLVVRISPEDRALVESAAAAHELDTSAWVRQTVVLAAKRWKTRRDAAGDSPQEPPGTGA